MAEFDPAKEIYLGDGLYCRFDGFGYILRAPREFEDHWVALEPEMIDRLQKHREAINTFYIVKNAEGADDGEAD